MPKYRISALIWFQAYNFRSKLTFRGLYIHVAVQGKNQLFLSSKYHEISKNWHSGSTVRHIFHHFQIVPLSCESSRKHKNVLFPSLTSAMQGRQEGGAGGQFDPRPYGLRGLIIEDF